MATVYDPLMCWAGAMTFRRMVIHQIVMLRITDYMLFDYVHSDESLFDECCQ
jgi:hypothetical protein